MIIKFATARRKIKSALFRSKHRKWPEIQFELNNKVLIGTHHKTGTVWLYNIFKAIAKEFDLVFFSGKQEEIPATFDIFLQEHSQINFDHLKADYRGIHLIRDPRDIIVSGCFYHQKSTEPWLHEKRKKFGGLTYQEKINSYASLDDKIMFDMENSASNNIKKMLDWQYGNPSFMEVKYEDLISDVDLILFHQIFTFLGFPGKAIPPVLSIAFDNSLFSGNINKTVHVRSGNARQWEKYFNHAHKARFVELFSDILIKLGYEDNNDWAIR